MVIVIASLCLLRRLSLGAHNFLSAALDRHSTSTQLEPRHQTLYMLMLLYCLIVRNSYILCYIGVCSSILQGSQLYYHEWNRFYFYRNYWCFRTQLFFVHCHRPTKPVYVPRSFHLIFFFVALHCHPFFYWFQFFFLLALYYTWNIFVFFSESANPLFLYLSYKCAVASVNPY